MSLALKPYPEYKDSGVPWLGEIPAHWSLIKTKYLFRERSEKGYPDEPLLAATQTGGVVRKENYGNRTVLAQKDLHLLKLVQVGDFVISLRSFQGGIEYAHDRGIVSPAYTILQPAKLTNPKFFTWLFKSKPYIENLSLFVTGIRQGQNIDYEKLSRTFLPVPKADEQEAISEFLAYVERRVSRLICTKQRLIELLNEQKQAIIHRAVTRGLDPEAPMKPTGLDWLPEVPEHWELVRLGRLIELTTGFPFSSEQFSQNEDDVRLLRGINVAPGEIRWNSVVRWPQSARDDFGAFELAVGDVILGMDRPIISSGVRAAMIGKEDVPSLLLQRVARLRPLDMLHNDYLLLLISGSGFSDYLAPIFTGISVPHISPEQIGAFRIALPPLSEQQAIISAIRADTSVVERAIMRARREIELIHEYRVRLISDVVTGRLDVREVELPEAGADGEGVVAGLDGLESIATEGSPDPEEAQDAALRH